MRRIAERFNIAKCLRWPWLRERHAPAPIPDNTLSPGAHGRIASVMPPKTSRMITACAAFLVIRHPCRVRGVISSSAQSIQQPAQRRMLRRIIFGMNGLQTRAERAQRDRARGRAQLLEIEDGSRQPHPSLLPTRSRKRRVMIERFVRIAARAPRSASRSTVKPSDSRAASRAANARAQIFRKHCWHR